MNTTSSPALTIDPQTTGENPLLISLNETINEITGQSQERALPPIDKLLGYKFADELHDMVQQTTVVSVDEKENTATLEYADGSQTVMQYEALLEKFNKIQDEANEDTLYSFSKIIGHKRDKRRGNCWMVHVAWDGYPPSWEPLSEMKKADPVSMAEYARDNKLLSTVGWKWAKKITTNPAKMIRLAKIFQKRKRPLKVFKFGVEVAQDAQHALQLDEQNNNHLWKDSIEQEIG